MLGNDSDPDGDPLMVIANTDPSNGTVVVNMDGSYTYTPNDGFSGNDSFTYTIKDGNGGEDTATVYLTVGEPPATSSVTGKVFHDQLADGLMDEGDEGLTGITVQLKDAEGTVIAETSTDANGDYRFDDLEAGTYSVGVVAPGDYRFSPQDVGGDDTIDSDVSPETGMTATFDLGINEEKTDIDAGLYKGAIIGDQVWFDRYHDGLRDQSADNKGFSGVKIFLLDAEGNVVDSTISGDNGYYRFTDVDPGTYRIQFSVKDATVNNAAHGTLTYEQLIARSWDWGFKDVGTDDTIDSDGSTSLITSDSFTDFFTVTSGEVDLTRDVALTPIAIDLNGDGEIGVTGETSSWQKDDSAELGRTVEFDLDADGELDTIEWFDGSGDGILVDRSKIGADGSIDGSALFGDEGGKYANGYEKLASHDANGDGVISDAELEGLGVWIDDGDAVLEEGELQTASEAGLTSISAQMMIEHDAEGRELMRSEAEVNGETVMTEDVWFAQDLMAEIEGDTQDVDCHTEEAYMM